MLRLQAFRAAHPQVIIGDGGFGVWQARIPEPAGEWIISLQFRREHPRRLRLLSTTLGWGDLRDDAAVGGFARSSRSARRRPARPDQSGLVLQEALYAGRRSIAADAGGGRGSGERARCVPDRVVNQVS